MTTPKVGAPELVSSQASKEETANEAFRYLEQGGRFYVIKDKDLTTPPGSPADGDCYVVAANGGAWSAFAAKDLAFYLSTAWAKVTPEEGVFAWVQDENLLYYFDGSAWSAFSVGAGAVTSVSKSASFTAVAGVDHYDLDTASAAITVTLDPSPATNDVVEIWDATGHAATHAISFDGNGHNIAGSATLTSFIAVDYGHARLRFNGTQWLTA